MPLACTRAPGACPTIRMRASRWARTTGRGPSGRSASQARHARISVSSTSSGARVSFGIESDRGRSGHAASPGAAPGAGRRPGQAWRGSARRLHHAVRITPATGPVRRFRRRQHHTTRFARSPGRSPRRRAHRRACPSAGIGTGTTRLRADRAVHGAAVVEADRQRRHGERAGAVVAEQARRDQPGRHAERIGRREPVGRLATVRGAVRATRTHRRACGSARGPWPDTARRNRAGPRAPSPDDRARSRS